VTARPRRVAAALLGLAVLTSLSCGKKGSAPTAPYVWPPPDPVVLGVPGWPIMPVPADNPTTAQGISLGRRLFHDPILSGDSTQSCASCHQPGRSFSDSRSFSVGIDGIAGTRNAPALVNPGWLPVAFWDGRAARLEVQAVEPVADPIEMHADWDAVVSRLQRHPAYPARFGAAFGTSTIHRDLVVRAIAQFERTLISSNARFDRFNRNQLQLTPMEEAGRKLFFTEKADCFHCHGNVLGTDHRFHNVGADPSNSDPGRGAITGQASDMGLFKTPTLRNSAFTAPYFHNARYATLREVIEHYNNGVSGVANLDPLIRPAGVGLGMTSAEIDSLLAFILTLSDSSFLADTSHGPPGP
jgi:cytochrome c peroxidase